MDSTGDRVPHVFIAHTSMWEKPQPCPVRLLPASAKQGLSFIPKDPQIQPQPQPLSEGDPKYLPDRENVCQWGFSEFWCPFLASLLFTLLRARETQKLLHEGKENDCNRERDVRSETLNITLLVSQAPCEVSILLSYFWSLSQPPFN